MSPPNFRNPRSPPPTLVLPDFASEVVSLLEFSISVPWKDLYEALPRSEPPPEDTVARMMKRLSVETLYEWLVILREVGGKPAEEQLSWWLDLAHKFRDWFHMDYNKVYSRIPKAYEDSIAPIRDEKVFCPPRDPYNAVVILSEEDAVKDMAGRYVREKLVHGWKQGKRIERNKKCEFMEKAGTKERFEVASKEIKDVIWKHLERIVVAARAIVPPRCRVEAEYPILWDMAEADARAHVPRNPEKTEQNRKWHEDVIKNAQARYEVYLRKARNPMRRPEGHKTYPLA